jgi:excinuclease ABC subunit B
LVAIIDADKEGFLRSNRSLTQTVGRAARHLNGKAIMYADTITQSMQETIDQTSYRREKQEAYNKEQGVTPTALNKPLDETLRTHKTQSEEKELRPLSEKEIANLSKGDIDAQIKNTRKAMEKAAKELDFMEAARLRDHLKQLQAQQ